MRSKILSFNRGMIIQDIRNVGWVGLIYFVALTFAMPLQLLLVFTNEHHYSQNYFLQAKNLFVVSQAFQVLLMFLIPVLMAIFLFRYIQVKDSADYVHSLPIRRETLYIQHVLFGVVMLFAPILATGISLFIVNGFIDAGHLLSAATISHWIFTTLLVNVTVFCAAVFVGMFTGISVLHGALTYILLLFPLGVTTLFFINLKFFLYGFAVDYYLNRNVEYLFPVIRVAELAREPLSFAEVSVYVSFALAFFAVGLFVYKKRHVEAATQAISFRPLRPIFKYGVTFCAMLLGGAYFGSMQEQVGWILFGYAIGSIIGYIVAEMILQKTWRVFRQLKGYVMYVVFATLVVTLMVFDITGYESRVPNVADVKGVYVSHSVHMLNEMADDYKPPFFQDAQTLEKVQLLHEKLVQEQPKQVGTHWSDYQQMAIKYELKNGKTLVRQFMVPIKEFQAYYGPIVESKEFKASQNPVLEMNDVAKIDRISIWSHRANKRISITDREDIQQVHAIIQEEILSQTYEETLQYREPWGSIEFLLNDDKRLHVDWSKSYEKFETWLLKKELLEQARVTGNDVSHVLIYSNEAKKPLYEFINDDLKGDNESSSFKISDTDKIDELLKITTWEEDVDYVVAFYYHNQQHQDILGIKANDVPQFISNHFKKG